ncbi:hypothetical protein ACP4OV_012877 [Aristida adscensionis]
MHIPFSLLTSPNPQLHIHSDAKGLYGIAFPYYETLAAIYAKDIATGEGAEGIGEAVTNLEDEIAAIGEANEDEEEDRVSTETPRRSIDSASSSSKNQKRDGKGKETTSDDPLTDMLAEVQGDLKVVSKNFGKIAVAIERESAIQEKALNEDPKEKLRRNAVEELCRLGFTGGEIVKAAAVFVKTPDQMGMLLTLRETFRREFILNMLKDEENKKSS